MAQVGIRRNISSGDRKDPRIGVKRQSRCGLQLEDPFQDLTSPWIERIAERLYNATPKSVWKTIASELGFSRNEVEEFVRRCNIRSEESGLEVNPALMMLERWMEREGSTIRVLYNAAVRNGIESTKQDIQQGIIGEFHLEVVCLDYQGETKEAFTVVTPGGASLHECLGEFLKDHNYQITDLLIAGPKLRSNNKLPTWRTRASTLKGVQLVIQERSNKRNDLELGQPDPSQDSTGVKRPFQQLYVPEDMVNSDSLNEDPSELLDSYGIEESMARFGLSSSNSTSGGSVMINAKTISGPIHIGPLHKIYFSGPAEPACVCRSPSVGSDSGSSSLESNDSSAPGGSSPSQQQSTSHSISLSSSQPVEHSELLVTRNGQQNNLSKSPPKDSKDSKDKKSAKETSVMIPRKKGPVESKSPPSYDSGESLDCLCDQAPSERGKCVGLHPCRELMATSAVVPEMPPPYDGQDPPSYNAAVYGRHDNFHSEHLRAQPEYVRPDNFHSEYLRAQTEYGRPDNQSEHLRAQPVYGRQDNQSEHLRTQLVSTPIIKVSEQNAGKTQAGSYSTHISTHQFHRHTSLIQIPERSTQLQRQGAKSQSNISQQHGDSGSEVEWKSLGSRSASMPASVSGDELYVPHEPMWFLGNNQTSSENLARSPKVSPPKASFSHDVPIKPTETSSSHKLGTNTTLVPSPMFKKSGSLSEGPMCKPPVELPVRSLSSPGMQQKHSQEDNLSSVLNNWTCRRPREYTEILNSSPRSPGQKGDLHNSPCTYSNGIYHVDITPKEINRSPTSNNITEPSPIYLNGEALPEKSVAKPGGSGLKPVIAPRSKSKSPSRLAKRQVTSEVIPDHILEQATTLSGYVEGMKDNKQLQDSVFKLIKTKHYRKEGCYILWLLDDKHLAMSVIHNGELLHYKIRYVEGEVRLNVDQEGASDLQQLLNTYIEHRVRLPTKSWRELEANNMFTASTRESEEVPPLPPRPKGGFLCIKNPLNLDQFNKRD